MKDVRLREATHKPSTCSGYELSQVCAFEGCTRPSRPKHYYCDMHAKRRQRAKKKGAE